MRLEQRSFLMKIFKTIIAVFLVLLLLAVSFYVFYMEPRRVVPILMYHSISDKENSSLHVSAENFAHQMAFLKEKGYSVISLDELVAGIKAGKKFPSKTVVITFDDGFRDNYLNAFPSLSKYDFPATIFLVTGYIGQKDEYLTWDQVRLMQKHDIDFGAHTRNNTYLPSVKDTKKLWEEVDGSKKDIETNTGRKANYFCYPIGGFNSKVKDAVIKAGYKGACTTNRGYDRYNKDIFELNRVKIKNSDITKPFSLRAKLSGYYNLFRSLKSPE